MLKTGAHKRRKTIFALILAMLQLCVLCYALVLHKGDEIRDTKTLNLSRNIVSLQVLVVRNQLVAQQKHLLQVEESCCEK